MLAKKRLCTEMIQLQMLAVDGFLNVTNIANVSEVGLAGSRGRHTSNENGTKNHLQAVHDGSFKAVASSSVDGVVCVKKKAF